MMLARLAGVLGLTLLLALGISTTAQGAKKKAMHSVHGAVVDVQRNEGNGTLTVKVHHKKKGAAAQEVDRKFQVTKATKVELVKGKKGAQERTPAAFGDVQSGQHVVIEAKGDVAVKITIHQTGKQKAKI